MKITLEQVHKALIEIANMRGREHFSMQTVREVVHAIRNNTHHPLKNITMQEIFNLYAHLYKEEKIEEPLDTEKALQKLREIRGYYAGQKVLVSRSGVSERTISLLLKKDHEISPRVWQKLSPVLDQVLSDLKRHHKQKENNSHGKYVTYRKGCRCDPCRAAWRDYIKDRNHRKKLESEKNK